MGGGRCNQARALEEDLWAAKGLRCKVHPRLDVGSVDGPRWQLLALGRIWRRVFLQRRVNGQVSDIWVSYLVVVSKNGDKLFEGTYGNPGGNEAGEYLTVTSTGDIMIYTDSDTTPGFGFLKITKNA